MTILFDSERPNSVSTKERVCASCGRKMVSRRRYEQLMAGNYPPRKRGERGRIVANNDRTLVRHHSHGVCTLCESKLRQQAREKAKAEKPKPPPKPKRTEPTKAQVRAQIVREEWLFLRQFGVSAEEAAPRLGVKVETLKSIKEETSDDL